MQIYTDYQLSDILWYKIGGKAKYFIQASSKEDIFEALHFIKEKNIRKVFICGLGSNLIFTDKYFDGAVLQITSGKEEQIRLIEPKIIESFVGHLLDDVVQFAFKHELVGLEWAGGLPGTVGAAVRGNVGAYGGEIRDSLQSAEILTLRDDYSYEIKTFTNDDLQFVYRGSIVKGKKGQMIVLSARFKLKKASKDELVHAQQTYEKNKQHRKDRHPLEYPNCGSVFKNIREKEKVEKVLQILPDIKEKVEKQWYGKVAAAYLIQQLGLQGYQIGNAQISKKHALFIVNLGGATAEDVTSIISTVQEKFLRTFGFTLEPEVEIVTN